MTNTYTNGDLVHWIASTPVGQISPSNNITQGWAPNSVYDPWVTLGPPCYAIVVTNTGASGAASVTVVATADITAGIQ